MVRTNGPNGPQRMTKLEASVTQLVNKATTGDLRAAKLLMEIVTSFPELIKKEEPLTIIVRAVDPPKYD